MSRRLFWILLPAVFCFAVPVWAAGSPTETVQQADQALAEIMAIRGKAIPEHLLAEAQGVAIVPAVIKVGFIAGARRGHGVILVRDNDGEWSLPQFVTLTGGSVGWQAGVEGSDIVLVFTSQKAVRGLMQRKFTLGADIAAAAGPVGRDVSAATDAGLKAEVLSYARSRGLFVGASIDGSALEIDNASHLAFYGSQSSELPHQIPQAAAKLRQDLVHLTPNAQPIAGPQATTNPPIRTQNPARLHALRGSLEQSSRQLLTVVSPEWQRYLALPTDVYSPGGQPQLDLLRKALGCYDQVAKNADYQSLTSHPEFQRTHELLREYTDELSAVVDAAIKLPPPPVAGEHEFTGKVLEVIDGDTIKVMHDGKPEVVRLSDINAPKLAQPHGDKAKKYAEELCLGDQARVVWERRDSEGRIVGSVDEEDEGLNVNLEMVKAGLAWDVAEDDWTLAKAESEARKAKLGVWADRHPIPPWEFQKQHKQPTSTAPEFNDASQPGTAGRILAPIRW